MKGCMFGWIWMDGWTNEQMNQQLFRLDKLGYQWGLQRVTKAPVVKKDEYIFDNITGNSGIRTFSPRKCPWLRVGCCCLVSPSRIHSPSWPTALCSQQPRFLVSTLLPPSPLPSPTSPELHPTRNAPTPSSTYIIFKACPSASLSC